MKVQRSGSLQQRQLQAEVRRILRLLERTRQTRRQVRLLVALKTGGSPGKDKNPGSIARPVIYRPVRTSSRRRLPGA